MRAPFPGGAALRAGARAWVLVDEDPRRALGHALAWAQRLTPDELHVLVDSGAGRLARRAGYFRVPPTIWRVEGRDLEAASPEERPVAPVPSAEATALAARLRDAGADVVSEHGAITGEVLGLEIARITESGDGARLEVGVGRHDREAFAMLHGDVPPARQLAEVVATVRRFRRSSGPDHPFRRLAQERWLRDLVVARPALAGADELRRIDGPEPRGGVKDVLPAAAAGIDLDGRPVVVACSVGIDLDLVPWGADARDGVAPDARLVLVVPERDDHAVTRRLAADLLHPAELVTVDDDWRSLT